MNQPVAAVFLANETRHSYWGRVFISCSRKRVIFHSRTNAIKVYAPVGSLNRVIILTRCEIKRRRDESRFHSQVSLCHSTTTQARLYTSFMNISYACYTKRFEISLALLWDSTVMSILVQVETNLKIHTEATKYLIQVYIS